MLFRDGCMNFNILFLKIENFSQFLLFLSTLFHSITVDEKYEFLNKCMFNIGLKNTVDVSCSVCTPNVGDTI